MKTWPQNRTPAIKKAPVLAAAVLLGLVSLASSSHTPQAPFVIPPHGQPQALIGGMDLESPTALAFDSQNRPYMFERRDPAHFGYLLTLRDGEWVKLDYLTALQAAFPDITLPAKRWHHALGSIAIDGRDRIYAVIAARKEKDRNRRPYYLLYSDNMGQTFHAYNLPGKAFVEVWSGHNNLDWPPAIGVLRHRKDHPARFGSYHDLEVFLPDIRDDALSLGDPIQVSSNCFGVANHSGGYSFAVTAKDKTHVVYGEIAENGIGNPIYMTTLDRNQRNVIDRNFLLDAPPKKIDAHSIPVIAADNKNLLHVLSGSHVEPILYTRLTPAGTWTEPALQTADKQTYATLVSSSDGHLHSVYRQHGSLRYVHKPADASEWSKPRELVLQPEGHSGYTIFYHRLFIDRADTLYLSFSFFEFNTREEGQYPRALAMSTDHGKTWQLAGTAAMQNRVIEKKKSFWQRLFR